MTLDVDLFGDEIAPVPKTKRWLTLWNRYLEEKKLPLLTDREAKMVSKSLVGAWKTRGYSEEEAIDLIHHYHTSPKGTALAFSAEGFVKCLRDILVSKDKEKAMKERAARENERVRKLTAVDADALAPADAKARLAAIRAAVTKKGCP